MWFPEDKKIYQELTFSVLEGIVGTYIRKNLHIFVYLRTLLKTILYPIRTPSIFPLLPMFMGYSFVDNTDLVQMGPHIESTSQEVLPLMQATLSLWEQGLLATSGALIPSKSFWYHIDFCWKGSHWRHINEVMGPETLLMCNHTQNVSPIK